MMVISNFNKLMFHELLLLRKRAKESNWNNSEVTVATVMMVAWKMTVKLANLLLTWSFMMT